MIRFRGIFLVAIVSLPAIVLRVNGIHPTAALALLAYGAAVVASSFLLAWAAEAARMDISGGLAIAVLALIAVLPEYAVDLYFAFTAGHDHAYSAYAAANMTGSNRLLMGVGWPVVVLLGLMVSRRSGNPIRALPLEPSARVELGFLMAAGIAAFMAPLTGIISLPLAVALLAWFGFYLFRMSQQGVEEPTLIGTAAAVGGLPPRVRRRMVIIMFASAAVIVLMSAQPFAESLIATGEKFGINKFLLVQWLAPLASEAPEFIVAILFALRGNAQDAIGTLISSKINQWTLLIGSLPIAFLVGGGDVWGLKLDGRQVEEMFLTAAQTLMGVAALLALRFPRWGAWTLLALFSLQALVVGTTGRTVLSVAYALIAVFALIYNRKRIVPTLAAPFHQG